MIIAVNIIVFGKNEKDAFGNFMYEVFARIVKAQTGHTFIIISEQATDNFIAADNIINVHAGPQPRHPARWLIWYNFKIKPAIKKYKADVFVSYGIGSGSMKVPQCIIVADLDFIYYPQIFKRTKLIFYKKYGVASLKKATLILTVSQFCKADISKRFKINADAIQVVYAGVDTNFIETTKLECEKIKTKYAGGNNYFLYTGETGLHKNLLNLIKAFSAFKKRQRSNMQLVIAGRPGFNFTALTESLRLFKFKDEVKIISDVTEREMKKIITAAYAFIYPSTYEAFPAEAIRAMKYGAPVITSSAASMPEICAGAALYADADNFKEIAVQMMHLFKNEKIREDLIRMGKDEAAKYSWDITAHLVWNKIEKQFLTCKI